MKQHFGLVLLSLSLAATLGCVKASAPVVGSANAVDSNSYLTLTTTDSVIRSTKAHLAAGSFPAAIVGNINTAPNDLLPSYNVAVPAYQASHAGELAGSAPQVQLEAGKNDLNI